MHSLSQELHACQTLHELNQFTKNINTLSQMESVIL